MTSRKQGRPAKPTEAPRGFAAILARVLELSEGARASQKQCEELRSQLQSLPAESVKRLGVLLNLGREAYDSAHVHTSVTTSHAQTLELSALCDGSTLSQQYLERGIAMACASNFEIGSTSPPHTPTQVNLSVYERAWSRFGRELAASEPSEWKWFAHFATRTRKLNKLYLRRGDKAWWSFSGGLDRPLRARVTADLRLSKNAKLGTDGPSLASLAPHVSLPERRALQRALLSVHARLGQVDPDFPSAARSADA